MDSACSSATGLECEVVRVLYFFCSGCGSVKQGSVAGMCGWDVFFVVVTVVLWLKLPACGG